MSEVLELNERVESQTDAERLAKKRLAEANRKELTASIKIKGNINYSASQNIDLSGFGAFDGKYVIEKVTHSISGNGNFTTTLELHVGNKAKGAKKKAAKGKKSGGAIPFCDSSQTYAGG